MGAVPQRYLGVTHLVSGTAGVQTAGEGGGGTVTSLDAGQAAVAGPPQQPLLTPGTVSAESTGLGWKGG